MALLALLSGSFALWVLSWYAAMQPSAFLGYVSAHWDGPIVGCLPASQNVESGTRHLGYHSICALFVGSTAWVAHPATIVGAVRGLSGTSVSLHLRRCVRRSRKPSAGSVLVSRSIKGNISFQNAVKGRYPDPFSGLLSSYSRGVIFCVCLEQEQPNMNFRACL